MKRKTCVKKGLAHVDWIVAILLFLAGVSTVFFSLSSSSLRANTNDITKEASIELANEISGKITWSLYKESIVVKALSDLEWPIELNLRLTDDLDMNSVIVVNETGFFTATDYDQSEMKVIFDSIIGNEKTAYVVYGKNTSLEKIQFNSSLSVSETQDSFIFKTAKINGTITTTGISDIKWNNNLVFETVDLNIASAKPANKTFQAMAKFLYDDANASIYHNSSKILVQKNLPETITFTTDTALADKYYNGTIIDMPLQNDGTIDSGTYSWIDFHKTNGNGFSIIGKNMSVTVTKSGTDITATISNVKEFEIFGHTGDYANAEGEKDNFLQKPRLIIMNPVKLMGISTSNADSLRLLEYNTLKNGLNTNLNFNYSISSLGIELGTKIPVDRTVVVQRTPTVYLDRYGNIQEIEARLAVWQ